MSDLIGQLLGGRYQVEASLGRGGMAEVFKVWDHHRATYLAMKVLREDLAEDRVFLRRFKREAQTLSRLQHPHIVRFYGLEQEGPLAFMLMDFVEGTSLRREIFEAGNPFPPTRVLEVMRSICAALHYAHSEGFIHCDIKPGNILIDRNGRVLVSDFGIARMTESATTTMVGAGTPAYMAPEQVRGEDPSPQTDIYALGVVLYEMLTCGERPFTGEQARTTGSTAEKVRWEHIYLKPPPPRVYNPQITLEIEAVVLKCLEKAPGDRYCNVKEFLSILEQAVTRVRSTETLSQQPADQLPALHEQEAEPEPVSHSSEVPIPQPALTTPSAAGGKEDSSQLKDRRRRTAWGWILGSLVLVTMLFIGIMYGYQPPRPDIPNPALATPSIERIAAAQATFGEVISSNLTPVPTPALTRTPRPTTTATITLPMPAMEVLSDLQVLRIDRFDSSWAKYWSHTDINKVTNDMLNIIGEESWASSVVLNRKLREGEGVLLLYQYTYGSDFEIFLDYGEWEKPNYRRFGIYGSGYPTANLYQGANGLGFNRLIGNFSPKPGYWYNLLLVVSHDGEFLALIWDPQNPIARIRYQERLGEKWAGLDWIFHIGANKGKVMIKDFMEISFNKIK